MENIKPDVCGVDGISYNFSLQSKDTNVEADDLINVFDKKEENIFHYICDTKGEILSGDVKIFDIKYTVESELRVMRVSEKKIAQINSALADLKVDEPEVCDNLGIRNVYLKQQKRVMKGQARYDILSEFSDDSSGGCGKSKAFAGNDRCGKR